MGGCEAVNIFCSSHDQEEQLRPIVEPTGYMDHSPFSVFLLLADSAAQTAPQEAGISIPVALIIVMVLLAVNGYFVALEFALVGVRKTKVDEMVRQQVRGALSVQRGKNHVDDFVAAAQLGITVASLALGMVAESTVIRILHEWFGIYHIFGLKLEHGTGLGLGISLTLVTVLHVVVGEQVPKMLAIDRPNKVALLTAPPAELFLRCSWPAIVTLNWLTKIVLKPLGVTANGGHGGQPYSEEEIESLLATRQKAGLSEPAESEMISQVFDLFDMVATQIMIPRTEMVCVPATATVRDIMEVAGAEGHDRYPVYGQNTDEIVGILLMKDLVSFLGQNPSGLDSGITSLWREPVFVPGTLQCSQLLSQLKEKRTRLAIVLDEYGGTAGMLTLGDVLHRIVGEVDEETEIEEPQKIVALGENLYSVSGLVLTEDVDRFFGVEIDDAMNDTIGGVVFSQIGRAPVVGDEIELQDGLTFRVDSLHGMRIDRLLVRTTSGKPDSDKMDGGTEG
jgi:magnesium and cobalt exporter, CNNM family